MSAKNLVAEFVRDLAASPSFGHQLVHSRVLPARKARFAATERPWDPAVAGLLESMGIKRLYAHQARAMDEARSGRSVAVATATASGKTLIYNLPVMEAVARDPEARALYLFPLKALAQDQLKTFEALASEVAGASPSAAIYDGDTKDAMRRRIRAHPPNALLTNPEMLHLALLPYHGSWAGFFSKLRYIVVDEMHTYRGVLGTHMAWVFRRLKRICDFYGASPTFVLCSATIGNPGELAERLTGSPVTLVEEDGSAAGKKHLLFVNPDHSMPRAAIILLKAALKRGVRTIVYTQSRKLAELLALWTADRAKRNAEKICAYRAGYLPEERRDIENRLAAGDLLAVVSTSALELGIDIGNLDLCLLAGYPGTVMATLQRGGRVGRKLNDSAVILVAGEDALDQYFMQNPEDFFARGAESAVINPENPVIAARHVECAAAELALSEGEPFLADPVARAAAEGLSRAGRLLRDREGLRLHPARKSPHRELDLRGAGDQYRILHLSREGEDDGLSGRTIGHLDGYRVFREAHPGAVYLHQGKTFLVKDLDIPGRTAGVAQARLDYYTRPRGEKDTEILAVSGEKNVFGARVALGRLKVTDRVTGFEKRLVRGGRSLGVTPLDLPPSVFETRGLWIEIPKPVEAAITEKKLHFMGGIHALEHAAIGILPLVVMCDRNDLGGISTPLHPQVGGPAVFIYDAVPGGVGLADLAFRRAEELLEKTRRVIESCRCALGCPSCVHSPKCGSGNRPIDKRASLEILSLIREGRPPEPRRAPIVLARPPEPGPEAIFPAASAPEAEGPLSIFLAGVAAAAPRKASPPDDFAADPFDQGHAGPEEREAVPIRPPRPPSRLLPRYGVLDVETRRSALEVGGWHRADLMGVSVAILYDSGRDEFLSFRQEEIGELVRRLAAFELVVGFNILRFDYLVLSGQFPYKYRLLPTLDMLAEVHKTLGYRLSLNTLAKATLGAEKSADGEKALEWWKEGRVEEIAAYCRQDVAVTRDLFLYGRQHGHLLFTNKAKSVVRVPVSW